MFKNCHAQEKGLGPEWPYYMENSGYFKKAMLCDVHMISYYG